MDGRVLSVVVERDGQNNLTRKSFDSTMSQVLFPDQGRYDWSSQV